MESVNAIKGSISNSTMSQFGIVGNFSALKNYLVIGVIILAVLLQWYAHGNGLFLTDDSKHYIAGGESFKNSFTLIDSKGHHFLFWPPLFPIILSALASPINDLVWLNIIFTICIAIVTLRIINGLFKHQEMRLLCFAFTLLGVHLLLISTFVWTELIFLVFVLVFVDQLQKSKESKVSFYLAIASGFLMCLQRNAGIFIAAGAALWVFVNEESWKDKIAKSAILFLTVSSGLLIWIVYIWFFVPHGHFTFSEEFFHYTSFNTNSLAGALLTIFSPKVFFPIPVLIVAFSIYSFFMREELRKDLSLQLIFVVTVVYLAFISLTLIVNIAKFPVDFGEADRFISVIVPFVGMLAFKIFDKIFERQNQTTRRLLTVLLCIWLCYPLARTIKNAMHWHEVANKTLAFSDHALRFESELKEVFVRTR